MRKYYRFYFNQLAISNKQLAFSSDRKSFVFIKDIYNLDAFDAALKSAACSPCLLLENYRTKLGDGNNRNYFKHLLGRFNVVAKVETGSEASIEDIQEQCEYLAEELIAKMREQLEEGSTIQIDADNTSKKVWFPVQDIEIDPIGPISTSYYGVTVSFFWKTPGRGKSNPANWN